uniref:DUF5855 domain-containing protein n=1 Tax=Bathycoccus sp. RCC716 virus 2 TaxID=2530039 RepID=A0A7S6NYC8_9PHYC|nr:hypothetical protein [Bathycoccus sp. RCC716 virus 2]
MDACDPGINIKDLKTLIKQNTGGDFSLTRSQICDVYSSIQDGKLPLPPLVLSKDSSYLIDRKSPLTRSDFEKLFNPGTKVTSIRRIAKKVGVARHADKQLTKAQLIAIIGRRLHSMNIHEPIKLKTVQKRVLSSPTVNNDVKAYNNNAMNNAISMTNINNIGNKPNNAIRTNNNNGRINGNNGTRNNINLNKNKEAQLSKPVNNVRNVSNNRNNNTNKNTTTTSNNKFRKARGGFLKPNKISPYSAMESLNKVNKAKKIHPYTRLLFGEPNLTNKNKQIKRNANMRLLVQKGKGPALNMLFKRGAMNMSKQQQDDWWENFQREAYPQMVKEARKPVFTSKKPTLSEFQKQLREPTTPVSTTKTIGGYSPTTGGNSPTTGGNSPTTGGNSPTVKTTTQKTNNSPVSIGSKITAANNKKNNVVQRLNKKFNAVSNEPQPQPQPQPQPPNGPNTGSNAGSNAGSTANNTPNKPNVVPNKPNVVPNKPNVPNVKTNNKNNKNNKNLQQQEKERKNAENKAKRQAGAANLRQKWGSGAINKNMNTVISNFESGKRHSAFFGGEGKLIYATVNNANKKLKEIYNAKEVASKKQLEKERKQARQEQIKTLEKFVANDPFLNKKSQNVKNIINQQTNTNVAKNMITKLSNQIKVNRKQKLSNFLNTNNARNHINNKNATLNRANKEPKKSIESIIADLKKQIEKSKKEAQIQKEANNKKANVQNLRTKYSSNENYNAIKKHINKFEKGGWFAPKTRQAVENKISKNRELAFEKRQKEAEKKEQEKKENNEWKNKPTRPTLSRSGPINKTVAKNKANSMKRIELANKVKKYIKNNNVKTLKTNTIVTKILAGAITNYNKAILEVNKEIKKKQPSNNKANGETNLLAKFNKTGQHERLKLFKKQAEVNKTKKEAEEALAIAAEKKKKREEANRKAKEAANKLAAINKRLANFKKAEKEEANRKAKEEANRKAKEEANRKAKEAANKKAKEEANRKAKEAANKKAKEEANRKAKEEAQNRQLRVSLTKKVKSTEMDQKIKNKLLNQLKNNKVRAKNIAPGIEQTIKSEKLNGNFNEAENKKKRQEVKKNVAKYIAIKYKNMSKADRKKYIDKANEKEWRKGIFRGTQGMGANQAYKRIIGNIERNMEAKKAANNKAKEEANRKAKEENLKRKQVQAKLINAMKNKPPPPPKNKKANLKKLVNNTMKGRAAKNVSRLKKNINEGVSEMAVKTRLAQLNKRTKYQLK